MWRKIHRITVKLFVPFLDDACNWGTGAAGLATIPASPDRGSHTPSRKDLVELFGPCVSCILLFDFLISDFSFVFPTVLQECDYQNHQSDSSGGHPCLDPCHTVSSASFELEAPQIKTLGTALLALLRPEICKQPLTWLSRPRGFLARLRAEVPSALT